MWEVTYFQTEKLHSVWLRYSKWYVCPGVSPLQFSFSFYWEISTILGPGGRNTWHTHLLKIRLPDLFIHSMASRRRRRRKLRQQLLWSRPPRAASPVRRRRCQLAAATRRRRRALWIRWWNSSRLRSWICLIKSNNVLGEISSSSYNAHQTKINTIPFFNPRRPSSHPDF